MPNLSSPFSCQQRTLAKVIPILRHSPHPKFTTMKFNHPFFAPALVSLSALLMPVSQADNLLADSGFDNSLTDIGGQLTEADTRDVWGRQGGTQMFVQSSTGGNPGGHIAWSGTGTSSGYARVFYQVITNDKASTGTASLSFDLLLQDGGTPQLEAAVWGVSDKTTASFYLRAFGTTFPDTASPAPGDANLLASWNLGGTQAQHPTWTTVTTDKDGADLDVDLGDTGYDLIIVGFWSRGIATDTDQFGMDNIELETDPDGPSDPAPKITSISAAPDTGDIELTFDSTPAATYTVFASSDLVGAVETWEEIDNDVASQGTETVYPFTDTNGIGQAERFYSVMRNP